MPRHERSRGYTLSEVVILVIPLIVWLTVVSAIGAVAVHFIRKWW